MENYSFDEIRPFFDSELSNAFKFLETDTQFLYVLGKIYPNIPVQKIVEQLKLVKTSIEFQQKFMFPLLDVLQKQHSLGITVSGLENLDKNKAYLFVSNHRDIILDSAFLNYIFLKHNFNTTEIAIGDNLLIAEWIRTIVRINKSFIIQRNAPIRQMVTILARQSAYIRNAITERNQSIWIAQREGRAKDSNDRTQESLLKMFALSGKGTFIENLTDLNICPIAISYEFDSCDYLKAKEFQQKKENPEFKKSTQDDLISMKQGLEGEKGHIHYHFCGSISEKIQNITGNKNEQVAAIAKIIDSHIHSGYKIYPCNQIAYDLLLNVQKYSKTYTEEEKSAFEKYLQERIKQIDLEKTDEPFVRQKMLEMYANILINQEQAKSETTQN